MSIIRLLRKNTLVTAVFQTVIWISKMVFGGKLGVPPAWIKRRYLLSLLTEFNPEQFIETGTYLGQTTKLVAGRFPELFIDTIEIDHNLFLNAQSNLTSYSPRIKVWHGDSKYILEDAIASRQCNRIFFWLDGHFSNGLTSLGDSETPLLDELEIISSYFASTKKVFFIVIDDFHEISINASYPDWIQIEAFALKNSCKVRTRWNTIVLFKE